MLASYRSRARPLRPSSLDLQRRSRRLITATAIIVTGDGHVRVRLVRRHVVHRRTVLDGPQAQPLSDRGQRPPRRRRASTKSAPAFAGYPDIDRSYFLRGKREPRPLDVLRARFRPPAEGPRAARRRLLHPRRQRAKGRTSWPRRRDHSAANDGRVPRFAALHVRASTSRRQKWVQNFSANSNYAQNAFAGASFDIGLPYNGSLHAVSGDPSALHRYCRSSSCRSTSISCGTATTSSSPSTRSLRGSGSSI